MIMFARSTERRTSTRGLSYYVVTSKEGENQTGAFDPSYATLI
jgi:hypothetical protein